jgi:hypothetical protein
MVGNRGAFAIAYTNSDGDLDFLVGRAGKLGILTHVVYKVSDGKLVPDESI